MAANHEEVVGDQMWQEVDADLPDSRFIPFRTDHLWTSKEIRDWVQSIDGEALSRLQSIGEFVNSVTFHIAALCLEFGKCFILQLL